MNVSHEPCHIWLPVRISLLAKKEIEFMMKKTISATAIG